jgi:hypothetical protein
MHRSFQRDLNMCLKHGQGGCSSACRRLAMLLNGDSLGRPDFGLVSCSIVALPVLGASLPWSAVDSWLMSTRVMRYFMLFDITSDLQSQAVSFTIIAARAVAVSGGDIPSAADTRHMLSVVALSCWYDPSSTYPPSLRVTALHYPASQSAKKGI